jgi:hypothetical protein
MQNSNGGMNKQTIELVSRLEKMGFTFEDALTLRRIEKTLHRWAELECGDGNDYKSWPIERDEETGRPFMCTYPHHGNSYRTAIADREAGALRRLEKIMCQHPELEAYRQSDPRGCALYIVRKSDIPAGESINAFYTRGVGVGD